MKLHEITEERFNLKRAIEEKDICPSDVVDAMVCIHNTRLEIKLNKVFDGGSVSDETVLFFWDYSGERPFVVRETEVKNGSIFLEVERTLLFQMLYLDLDSIRIGIAFRIKNEYFCGYCRNTEAKKEELQAWDRSIGKLASLNKAAFVAYWTEGGILSVRFRDEKKFDDEFYRVRMSGYYWENEKLTAYLDAPLMMGTMKIKVYSMSTQAVCRDINIELEREGNTELKSIWKITIDLFGMPSDDSDGYRLVCELDGHLFGIFLGCEVDADALCKITLQTGEQLNVCVVQNPNCQFIIKTGRVYPVMLSVVTAVYNTAPFLAEMINSVLSQNVKKLEEYCKDYRKDYYKDIFEFILVDDGSTDGSGDILDDYARISDRIRVIHKENDGVSSARNAGIEVARGKYINFADSDDKLSENFMEECLLFFEEHEDEIDFVATPMKFFDATSGGHWTNYKFKTENSVIDLENEPDAISPFVCSSFFKLCDVEEYPFDTDLSNGEDIVFIYELIMRGHKKIAAVSTCSYNYRRRSSGEPSAIDQSANNVFFYTYYLENVLKKLLVDSMDKNGNIPKFIQHNVMGQLQWRFEANDRGEKGKKVLGEKEFRIYKEKAFSLLYYIDDDVILSQRKIWSEHFYFILQKKYNCSPQIIKENGDIYFEFQGMRIRNPLGNCYIMLNFLNIKDGILYIEGYGMNYIPEIELLIYVNGEICNYNVLNRDMNKYTFDEVVFYATTFSVNILLEETVDKYEIEFYARFDGIEVMKKDFRFTKFMPLACSYKKSFYMKDGWTVQREDNKFVVYNMSSPTIVTRNFEKEFELEIKHSRNKDKIQEILELRKQALLWLAGKDNKKIWLISDRVNVAGDNGEAFFRYLFTHPAPDVLPYFVIDSNSPDFSRMQSFGRVVPYGSKHHHILHLVADYIVSSAADEFIINPWYENKAEAEIVRDFLARPDFIFLQHGVIKDDMSDWLNRYNKNIKGFICTAPREAQSILDFPYYYKPENVWLTGLPRHDILYHDEKNYITIMPTWRQYLTDESEELVSDFSKSKYFMFYNTVINDDRLLSAADVLGYRICFMPHPRIKRKGLSFFKRDSRVVFFDFDTSYTKVYAESRLVVTDYSSSIMDFVLLHKPVVYCQFDKDEFFENHTYKEGYYDYERDGFGEVTYNMETLIDIIIDYMHNNCELKQKYLERINGFFMFNDRNNCERVYKKIVDNSNR